MVAITRKLDRFDKAARSATTVEGLQRAWKRCVGKPLTSRAALNFLRHYNQMRSKARAGKKVTRRQRGGAFTPAAGAPTDYVMGPGQAGNVHASGFPVSAAYGPVQFGHFTDDVTSYKPLLNNVGGPAEIWKIAQTEDCGVDRFPTDPSKAQVGGRRKNSRKNNSSRRNGKSSCRNTRKSNRSRRQRQRGGNLLNSLASPFNFLGFNSVTAMGFEKPLDSIGNIDHTATSQYSNGTLFDVSKVSQLNGMTPTNTLQAYAPAAFASASGQLFGTAQEASMR